MKSNGGNLLLSNHSSHVTESSFPSFPSTVKFQLRHRLEQQKPGSIHGIVIKWFSLISFLLQINRLVRSQYHHNARYLATSMFLNHNRMDSHETTVVSAANNQLRIIYK